MLWVPIVHNRFLPGLNKLWFGKDVLPIFIITFLTAYLLFEIMPATDSRLGQIGILAVVFMAVVISGLIASSMLVSQIKSFLNLEKFY